MKENEVEDQEWQEEVSVLRTGIERLTSLVEDLVAGQNQPSPKF